MFLYKYAQPNCHAIVDLKPRNIQYSMQTILANKILPFPTSKTVEYTEFSRKKNPPADFSTGGNKMYRGIFIPTLFRDYHLYYFISILSYFCTVLGLFFFVLFSLSFPVLQNMLQLSLLNSTRWFAPITFPSKKAQHCVELFFFNLLYTVR